MFQTLRSKKAASIRAAAMTTLIALAVNSAAEAHGRMLPAFATFPMPKPAASAVYTTIDDPADPTFNQLLGINNAGVISGYFGSGAAGHPNKGYTIAPPYKSFVSDNLPGSTQTQATGINDVANAGVTSGFWAPTNLGGGDANFGFIHWNALYVSANYPLVSSVPVVDQLLGINDNYIAVGFYNDAGGASHGYAFALKTGAFQSLTFPTVAADAATGISNKNLVCGFYTKSTGKTDAYLRPLAGGTITAFAIPGAMTTQFLGVNGSAIAVGFYLDANSIPHGVIYNSVSKKYVVVNAPNGVGGTTLNGINDKNQIVGFYVDGGGNTHGLLLTGATP